MSTKKTLSDQDRETLARRYLAGESHSALSRATGMSRFVIRRELGPPQRSAREAQQVLHPDAPGARIIALKARVHALEAGLLSLEWGDKNDLPDNHTGYVDPELDACQVCNSYRMHGHTDDCALVPLLATLAGSAEDRSAGAG